MDRNDQGLSKFFSEWKCSRIKERDGSVSTIYTDERSAAWLSYDDDGLIGPGKIKGLRYVLYGGLTERELDLHKVKGLWRPGRLVIQTGEKNYQVWVRYDDKAPRQPREADTLAVINAGSQIVHCDDLLHEKAHRMDKMSPILEKLDRYFGEYEFGVYKEAEGDKDGAVWTVKPTDNTIGYLKAMNAQGKHIFIRPTFDREPHFMMHDDLDADGLARHHKNDHGQWLPGRLAVESSSGEFSGMGEIGQTVAH